MTDRGSSVPSTSLAGIPPFLKLLCWLGLHRKCVRSVSASLTVEW